MLPVTAVNYKTRVKRLGVLRIQMQIFPSEAYCRSAYVKLVTYTENRKQILNCCIFVMLHVLIHQQSSNV